MTMPVLALAISCLSAAALVPLVGRVCLRFGQVALPSGDRWHRRPTPNMGGVGIFLAFALALGVASIADPGAIEGDWGLLIGAAVIFLIGVYDDLRTMTPQAKLVGQITAAAVVIGFGYTTTFFTPRIEDPILAQIPNILLTFTWIVGITNAVNLLDNMDGLAGGISLITSSFLAYLFHEVGNDGLLLIALALAGASLGFLIHNFPPASVFMGDSGSLLLGFVLAVMAIARQPQASNVFAVLGVPTLLFMLPIVDTILVTFTRLLRGQSPAHGGADHTSHRLIAFGLSERQAVLALYAVAVISGISAVVLESVAYWLSLAVMPLLVVVLAVVAAYLGRLRVVADDGQGQSKAVSRVMAKLTYRGRILEVLLDFVLIGIAYYLSLAVVESGEVTDSTLRLFLRSLPIVVAASFVAAYAAGVYRGVWRYVGIDEIAGFVRSAGASALLAGVAATIAFAQGGPRPLVFAVFGVLLFVGMAATRSSFVALDRLATRRTRRDGERVVVVGAGDSAEMAVRWMLMRPELCLHPIGYVDEDPYLAGREIHGIPVLGGRRQLEAIVRREKVNGIVVAAMPGDGGTDDLRETIDFCRRQGIWVKTMTLGFESID